ncbi:MAG: hypothetical protein QOH09_4966 [Pseudonocardiales bacterium]|jgi:hypothetical protein|nr:hypothetical protein [Pseudonocardiales bacterium]
MRVVMRSSPGMVEIKPNRHCVDEVVRSRPVEGHYEEVLDV